MYFHRQTVNELSDHFSGNKEKEFSLEQELKDNTDFRQDVQERFLLYKERREQKLKMLKVRNISSVFLAKWFNQSSKSGFGFADLFVPSVKE
jgi:hypothetical protein